MGLLIPLPLIAQPAPVVELESGRIRGVSSEGERPCEVFRAIPFAAPPVGENRWRAPQPVLPWKGVRDASEFSPACPQSDILSRRYGVSAPVLNEDCLYLNVFTPDATSTSDLPVMVWFYGGGFAVGDASTYDMSRLARQGVVVVTVNYRVNVFGFLAHPALTAESPHESSGNYGLLDMVAALEWVQRNIQAFGGSPESVTIFGQSAGASAVCHLMASGRTKGLFHRAIAQSGGAYDREATLKEAEAKGALFFQALGVASAEDPLAAARALPWEAIFKASQQAGIDGSRLPPTSRKPRLRFGITIDGWLLDKQTPQVFHEGNQQAVPLLIGSNANESDEEFTSAARFFAASHRRLTPQVFRYFFSQPSPDPIFQGRGAVHAAEIPYVMRGNARVDAHFSPEDWALSEVISNAWIQFAQSGDPHFPDAPFNWPRYDTDLDPYLEWGPEIRPGNKLRSTICDTIDRLKETEIPLIDASP